MHPKISVAVPTRHRAHIISKFVETFDQVTNDSYDKRPYLTIFYDAPQKESAQYHFTCVDYANWWQEITLHEKHSLTEMWNKAAMFSPTDWVFICNDDIEFKPGWLSYLEEKIKEGNHDLIHLFHYGAMLFHKSLILKVGWFDERFRGGGYEDNDYQLRLSEAGLKGRVDRSHDFIRRERDREVGHFIDHTKFVHKGEGWQGNNNADWIKRKWRTNLNWSLPAIRQADEIDWHPAFTKRYEKRFGYSEVWSKINKASRGQHKEIYH